MVAIGDERVAVAAGEHAVAVPVVAVTVAAVVAEVAAGAVVAAVAGVAAGVTVPALSGAVRFGKIFIIVSSSGNVTFQSLTCAAAWRSCCWRRSCCCWRSCAC